MSATNPLLTGREQLERASCFPHGQPYNFRAYCPVHGGENPDAWHVAVGADGSALLTCHVHRCSIMATVAALGLTLADLFPAGHHRARRRHLHHARRSDFAGNVRRLANVILAVVHAGIGWRVQLHLDVCPHCGAPGAVMFVSERNLWLTCPGDAESEALGYIACTLDQVEQALAARIEDERNNGRVAA